MYEYKIIRFGTLLETVASEVEFNLNLHAQTGWELYAVVALPHALFHYLRRLVKENKSVKEESK